VESSVRSALVAAAVALILGAFRLRDASLRHGAWTAVLAAMLLMPALLYVTPSIALPEILARPMRVSLPAVEGGNEPVGFPGVDRRSLPTGEDQSPPVPSLTGHVPTGPAAIGASAASTAVLALWLYGAVVLALLTRGMLGYRQAARIAGDGRRIIHGDAGPLLSQVSMTTVLLESPAIVTPMTVGAISPVILLPPSWRSWSEARMRAVLAHEMAHVRRRDPLVAILAHVNRCVFWFHPVAWWLERALETNAEHACDEAAVRATGERETYARTLVDMAQLVSRCGGRVAWRGAGMDGRGRLGRRIDHILNASPSVAVSPRRRAATAVCCLAATFLVVSCRPRPANTQIGSAGALEQSERKLRADLERVSRTQWPVGDVDGSPDPAQVVALEAAAARDPDDLTVLKSLLVAYWIQPPADLAKRRGRILWLIEHHPDVPLAGSIEARLFPNDLEPAFPGDPVGYQQARALWLSLADDSNVRGDVLGNAASFLETTDSSRAEQLLRRARAADPSGPWTAQLGRLYATVLGGSDAVRSRNRLRKISHGAPRTAAGLAVRQTLGESRDHELLTAAGWFLARGVRGPSQFREFDPDYWAEWCYRRALRLEPAAIVAHTELLDIRSRRSWSRGERLWSEPPARAYEGVAALPEAERFERLPHLARSACRGLESMARWDDDPLIRDRMELSKRDATRYAQDALALAPRYRDHPQYGTAIYLANMTLGTLALRDGDTKKAVLFLRSASRAPASEELAYSNRIVSSWHLGRGSPEARREGRGTGIPRTHGRDQRRRSVRAARGGGGDSRRSDSASLTDVRARGLGLAVKRCGGEPDS
jgi:beta-lactamase regulating signal transducer with metallopeptidase domain